MRLDVEGLAARRFLDKVRRLGLLGNARRLSLEGNLIKLVLYEKIVGEEKRKKTVIRSRGPVIYQPIVNVIVLDPAPDVIENARKLYGKDSGFVRKDLLPLEQALLCPRKGARELIREFKGFIPNHDFQALMVAEAICYFEDAGDRGMARAVKGQLESKYGERGARIYNLYRSGYVQDYFIFKLKYTIYECSSRSNAARLFLSFWNAQIDFFDQAVWSNEMMTESDIAEQVRIRLAKKDIRRVSVYARGGANIQRISNAVQTILESDPNYRKSEESYPIAGTPCLCITLEKIG